jgi:predicted dehydrogenase
MINVGIIGYGYWGPNIARNFSACDKVDLIAICEKDEKRLKLARSHYPFINTYTDAIDLISSDQIDVVAVITPVFAHYELTKKALEMGKHVFVEKPFTTTTSQGEELINLAEKKKLKIMVDHTFLFTGAVRKMHEIIKSGELGGLYFYDSVRVNLGLFQHDINVIWDLAPHDFSIMNYLIDKKPVGISATGTEHFSRGLEDVAYVAVHFENGFIAHFHCNWLSPVKVRKTLISGDKKMLVWDDMLSDEKIKVYNKGVDIPDKNGIHKLLVSYRSGDAYIPKVDHTEALKMEVEYFAQCIEKNEKPFNDGEAGLEVVRMLEAADLSLKSDFKRIKL